VSRRRETPLPTGFGFGPPKTIAQRSKTPSAEADQDIDRDSGLLTIGEVAEQYGVTLRTLRFYEQKGLLAPARRGSARLYGPRELSRLAVILKGKTLGFTLQEIQAMLEDEDAQQAEALPLSPDQVREQLEHLERQKAEIERAIAALRGYGA
jgi:DNA-binding transcriptional MerR regulator